MLCSLNIFVRSSPTVGSFMDSSYSKNSCTKYSCSLPKGRLYNNYIYWVPTQTIILVVMCAEGALPDTDKWFHMQCVLEKHVQKFLWICTHDTIILVRWFIIVGASLSEYYISVMSWHTSHGYKQQFVTVVSKTSCSHFFGQWSY